MDTKFKKIPLEILSVVQLNLQVLYILGDVLNYPLTNLLLPNCLQISLPHPPFNKLGILSQGHGDSTNTIQEEGNQEWRGRSAHL